MTRSKCTAKRLIGRIPKFITDAVGNENLRWGVPDTFIDIRANEEYPFKAGYKLYRNEEAADSYWDAAGESFNVKWKNALSLAAQGAVALSLLAAVF